MAVEALRLTLRLKHAKKTRLRLDGLSLVFILGPGLCLVFALEPHFALRLCHYLLDVCPDSVRKPFKSRIFIQTVCLDDGRQRVVGVVRGLGYAVDGIRAPPCRGLTFSGRHRTDGI